MTSRPTSNNSARKLSAADMDTLFHGPIKPMRRSPLYVLGLLIVTIAMVLLPLIYLGLILAVGYAGYYHAVNDIGILNTHGHGGSRGRLFAYLAPLFICAVLILFMLKPLIARRPRGDFGHAVSPKGQPVLFAFVERLSRLVGAPRPAEIVLDCDVNASASFRRGAVSMLGSDLTLTIGLPLVAGMSLREFGGVLAHELGHFSQGLGMRLSYIIRAISGWFARVVYERDAWDERLAEAGRSGSGYIMVLIGLTRLCVWITRRILWVLMMAGHGISCFMLRRMEYDADRYEARVAGSRTFAEAAGKLRKMVLATRAAHHDLGEAWRQRRLPDNFPGVIMSHVGRIPIEILREVEKQEAAQRTGFFDTHPCDRDRIREAEKLNSEGLMQTDLPASALFTDFDQLCRTLTRKYYQLMLEQRIDESNLVKTEQVLSEQTQASDEWDALESYLGHDVYGPHPVRYCPDQESAPSDSKSAAQKLQAIKRKIETELPRVVEAYEQHATAVKSLFHAEQAALFSRAGIRYKPEIFDVPAATAAAAAEKKRQALAEMHRTEAVLAPYETLLQQRITCALFLAHDPRVTARLENAAELLREIERITPLLMNLDPTIARYNELVSDIALAFTVLDGFQTDQENQTLRIEFKSRLAALRDLLIERRDESRDLDYPFPHASKNVTVAEYLIPEIPSEGDLRAILETSEVYRDNLSRLHARAVARVCMLASKVEALLWPPKRDNAESSAG